MWNICFISSWKLIVIEYLSRFSFKAWLMEHFSAAHMRQKVNRIYQGWSHHEANFNNRHKSKYKVKRNINNIQASGYSCLQMSEIFYSTPLFGMNYDLKQIVSVYFHHSRCMPAQLSSLICTSCRRTSEWAPTPFVNAVYIGCRQWTMLWR